MIDVEQRALRALKQNALARSPLAIQELEGRRHEGQNLRRDGEKLLAYGAGARRRQAHPAAKRIMMGEQTIDPVVEPIRLREIHQPYRAPGDLVLVGRTNAAPGCADLGSAHAGRFAMGVEFAMEREDERDILGDLEIVRRHLDALAAQFLDLVDQMVRIEDDAVADHRKLARAHDARGQKRKLEHFSIDHQGVAGVMAALEPHDDVGAQRKPIDDLALPDRDNIGHRRPLSSFLKHAKPRRQRQ